VSAAAAMPVPAPVSRTAIQKRRAPDRTSVVGMASLFASPGAGDGVNALYTSGAGLFHPAPGRIRIETRYRDRGASGRGSNVFLIYNAVLIHYERVDSRHSILRRPGHKAKPADQLVLHRVVVRSTRRIRTLPIQYAEKVSMVRPCFFCPSQTASAKSRGTSGSPDPSQ